MTWLSSAWNMWPHIQESAVGFLFLWLFFDNLTCRGDSAQPTVNKKHFQFKDLQTRQTRSHKFTTAFLLSKDDELLLIGVHYFWQKQNKQGKKKIFRLTTCHLFLQPEIRKCWCSWVAFLNESCNAQVQPSVISLISSVLDNFVHPPAFYPFVVPCKRFGLGIEYTR